MLTYVPKQTLYVVRLALEYLSSRSRPIKGSLSCVKGQPRSSRANKPSVAGGFKEGSSFLAKGKLFTSQILFAFRATPSFREHQGFKSPICLSSDICRYRTYAAICYCSRFLDIRYQSFVKCLNNNKNLFDSVLLR